MLRRLFATLLVCVCVCVTKIERLEANAIYCQFPQQKKSNIIYIQPAVCGNSLEQHIQR